MNWVEAKISNVLFMQLIALATVTRGIKSTMGKTKILLDIKMQ